jgi:photosystem II stability/assembly factor-like uncharacterized protein
MHTKTASSSADQVRRRTAWAVLGLLVSVGTSAQSWQAVPSGTAQNLTSIEPANGNDCWITGENGLFSQGTNCEAFVPFTVGVGTTHLTSQTRQSSVDVWVGGQDGVVRRQVALDDWENRNIPGGTGETFVVFSRSSGASWAAGDAGRLFRNSTGLPDGWELSHDAGVPLYGGDGFISSITRVVGAGGLILETTDGGQSWAPLTSGTTADLHDFVPGPNGSLLGGC